MKLTSGAVAAVATLFTLSFQAQATTLIQAEADQTLYQTLEHHYNASVVAGLPGGTTESLGLYTGRCYKYFNQNVPANAALFVDYINFTSPNNGPIATQPAPELNYWHTWVYGASPAYYDRLGTRRSRTVRAQARRNAHRSRLPQYNQSNDSLDSRHITLTFQHRQYGPYTMAKVVDALTLEPVMMCYYFR